MNTAGARISFGARSRAVLVALVLALSAAVPAFRCADAAEGDPIFEDGFEISGASTWSTAVGLPPGARLDVYLDDFQTLDSTEIIPVVNVDFSPAPNIGAVISGYVKVAAPGNWQLRLEYSPLGDLRVDGVLIGGYLGGQWYCQSNNGTVESPPEALAGGAILQFQIRYFSGCITILWDQTVRFLWRANAGDAWALVPPGSLFH
jgi:hypothetical protein